MIDRLFIAVLSTAILSACGYDDATPQAERSVVGLEPYNCFITADAPCWVMGEVALVSIEGERARIVTRAERYMPHSAPDFECDESQPARGVLQENGNSVGVENGCEQLDVPEGRLRWSPDSLSSGYLEVDPPAPVDFSVEVDSDAVTVVVDRVPNHARVILKTPDNEFDASVTFEDGRGVVELWETLEVESVRVEIEVGESVTGARYEPTIKGTPRVVTFGVRRIQTAEIPGPT